MSNNNNQGHVIQNQTTQDQVTDKMETAMVLTELALGGGTEKDVEAAVQAHIVADDAVQNHRIGL